MMFPVNFSVLLQLQANNTNIILDCKKNCVKNFVHILEKRVD